MAEVERSNSPTVLVKSQLKRAPLKRMKRVKSSDDVPPEVRKYDFELEKQLIFASESYFHFQGFNGR